MGRIAVVCSGVLTLLLAVPAHAVSWVCGLSEGGTQLVCVADEDPLGAPQAAAAAAAGAVNGTAFPLDARREWRVDFWSPGAEPERVEQLARATICWRSPGCSVTLGGERWAALVAAQHPQLTARARPRSR